MRKRRVFISLGASLRQTTERRTPHPVSKHAGDAAGKLEQALELLAGSDNVRVLAQSDHYRTRAWGQQRAGAYLNAAACLETNRLPLSLLALLQRVEYRFGRRRPRKRWGPRPLDLDILLYGIHRLRLAQLQIPHRWMWQRTFVLRPLSQLEQYLDRPRRQQLRHALCRYREGLLVSPRRCSSAEQRRKQIAGPL